MHVAMLPTSVYRESPDITFVTFTDIMEHVVVILLKWKTT